MGVLANWATDKGTDWASLSAEDLYSHVKDALASQRCRITTLEQAKPAHGDKLTFRVTCYRLGTHSFSNADAEREIARALEWHFGLTVKSKDFDVHVRADVIGGWCILGTQCNARDLSLRHKLVYMNRVT